MIGNTIFGLILFCLVILLGYSFLVMAVIP